MNDELRHWGIKGMKWGVRRYQNKDGTLTKEGRDRNKNGNEKQVETVEQKRSRLLKSSNAKELYENRHLLTTNEINERINRIDAEAKLASKITERHKKTGMERVNKGIEWYKKVDEAYNTVSKSSIGKALAEKLGLKEKAKPNNWDEVIRNLDNLSSDEIQRLSRRATNEQIIRRYGNRT